MKNTNDSASLSKNKTTEKGKKRRKKVKMGTSNL